MDETRTCPYCGESIRAEAIRCRYCRSRLTTLDPERWHRDHAERRVAGVAAALARAFTVPVGAVRLGFIVLTFFHLLGPILYGALWLVIPFAPGGTSPFERGRATVENLAAQVRAHWHDGSARGQRARHGERPRSNGGSSGLPVSLVP